MNKIQVIQSEIANVQTAIEAAVFAGDDSQSLRETLAAKQAELAQATAEAAQAAELEQQAEAGRVEAASAEAVAVAHQNVVAASGSDTVADVVMPTPEADPAVEAAAARLSAARERLAVDGAAHREQTDKLKALQSRLAEKQSAHDAILARRLAGDEKKGDAAEISLLASDIGTLSDLADRAKAIADANVPTEAQILCSRAEGDLSQAHLFAVFKAKQARLQTLEAAFIELHSELTQASAHVGVNRFSAYRPSQELRVIAYGTGH